jgi:hypothetical protein
MKAFIHLLPRALRRARGAVLAARALHCPLGTGVYQLYRGRRLLHIGMTAGGATLRSEVLAHARGDYGAATQRANRVEWEVARDPLFAYHRFQSIYDSLAYVTPGSARRTWTPSRSRRHATRERPRPNAIAMARRAFVAPSSRRRRQLLEASAQR